MRCDSQVEKASRLRILCIKSKQLCSLQRTDVWCQTQRLSERESKGELGKKFLHKVKISTRHCQSSAVYVSKIKHTQHPRVRRGNNRQAATHCSPLHNLAVPIEDVDRTPTQMINTQKNMNFSGLMYWHLVMYWLCTDFKRWIKSYTSMRVSNVHWYMHPYANAWFICKVSFRFG